MGGGGEYRAGQTQGQTAKFRQTAPEIGVSPGFAANYPAQAQRRMRESFGGWPCIRMATRKMRAATQVPPAVHNRTPARPTHGCHAGTPTGMAWRRSMSMGVNGGSRLMAVAKGPLGSAITGTMTKNGIMIGTINTMA